MLDLENPSSKFFMQPLFLVGTYDSDGSPRFAPISWISYTDGKPPCLVMTNYLPGKHMTENLMRDKQFTATVVTQEYLPFAEWNNKGDWIAKGRDPRSDYSYIPARKVHAPLIEGSVLSYECTIIHTVDIGDCRTYFGRIDAINASDEVAQLDYFDLTKIKPVIYSPSHYFTIGESICPMGTFVGA